MALNTKFNHTRERPFDTMVEVIYDKDLQNITYTNSNFIQGITRAHTH